MANYSNLKTAIENAVDWNNGDNEITGQNLLDILETIIDSLGAKYKFADVATPSSSITTPDEPLFYLAGEGTYTNFSGLSVTIPRGTLAIFYYDTAWHYTTVRTDSDAFFNVNQYLGTPSTTYTKANGRNAVPSALRSKGMIITYLTTNGWLIEQNLSTSGTWNADANWQTIGPVSVSQNISTGGYDLSVGENTYNIADQTYTIKDCGEIANQTTLASLNKNGFYKVGSEKLAQLTDLPADYPSGYPGLLINYNIGNGDVQWQVLLTAVNIQWYRLLYLGSPIYGGWNKVDSIDMNEALRGYEHYINSIGSLGYTKLTQCDKTGHYKIGAESISSIEDLPTDFSAPSGAILLNLAYGDGVVWQLLFSDEEPIYTRLCYNGTALSTWKAPIAKKVSRANGLIIGDSIAEGTISVTSSQDIVVPEKSYVRVALESRSINVTNVSKGGLGFLCPSNDGTTLEQVLNGVSFANYGIVCIALGINDYMWSNRTRGDVEMPDFPIGTLSDADTANTIIGKLKKIFNTCISANPSCKIVVLTPFNVKFGGGTFAQDYAIGLNNASANNPYNLQDLTDALISVCEEYHIQYISGIKDCIINKYTMDDLLPDWCHPNEAGTIQLGIEYSAKIPYSNILYK